MILRIKDLREDKDMLQKELAFLLKTTQQQYSKYELGERLIPLDKLITLAEYYNVSLDYICNRTNKKEVNK